VNKPTLDHKCRTMWDDGISEDQWFHFRFYIKPLACREKVRVKHWQRKLYDSFEIECDLARIPEDRALIERVIETMAGESRSWLNPQLFDEVAGRAALRKAFDTILAAQDSTGTNVPLEDDGELSQPVDVTARTAELARELGL
jgi:hypothetical protein